MKALPILLVLLMLWSAIWRPGPGDYVARELELELPTAQTTDTYDDHGGFHGDGLLHTELTFSPEDGARVEEAVSHHPSGRWNPFPMDDKMESFLYRGGAAELAGWTVPERGWWYLLDRQEDREGSMFQRSSFNYTLAVYDSAAATCPIWNLTPEEGERDGAEGKEGAGLSAGPPRCSAWPWWGLAAGTLRAERRRPSSGAGREEFDRAAAELLAGNGPAELPRGVTEVTLYPAGEGRVQTVEFLCGGWGWAPPPAIGGSAMCPQTS